MLQLIRDNATGWIAWGIVILISIPFALWGIHQYVTPDSSVAVASVDDTEIGYYDFQRRYARRRQQVQSVLGARLLGPDQESRLRREVLDGMIDSQVVISSGMSAGMRVGDEQLARTIQTQEVFRAGDDFSQDAYENWLRSQGYSPGGFEEELRRSLLEQQIALGVSGSDFMSTSELRDSVRMRLQKRTFSLLTIPASDFAGAEPAESEVAAHFEQHRDAYMAPERLRLRYLEISMDEIATGIKVDDDELRALFEAERERFVTPEKREVSHILISVPADADSTAEEEARARLAVLRSRIEVGESFEDLARDNSDDPGSATAGGSLGFIERGVMVPPFEEAAFALEPGQLSEPVRSSYGWHLIRVTSVQGSRGATFEEVREQVLAQYRTREAERIYVDRAETLANVTYEHPESLEAGAQELGLSIRETGPVTRAGGESDDPIASQPAVVAAAFSSDVLDEGNNSEPIEFESGRMVVVRAFDHEPPRALALEEARAQITSELQAEARRSAVTERGRDVLAQLRGGRSTDAVAVDTGLEWSRFEDVGRAGGELSERLLEVAFRMPRPEVGSTRFDGVVDANGDFAIISLVRVDDGDVSALSDDESRSLNRALEADIGRIMFDAFVRGRREASDVQIVEQNIES